MGWQTRYVEFFSSTSQSEFEATGTRDQTDLLCVDIYPGYCDFPEFSAFTTDHDETDVFVQEIRALSTDEGPEWLDWIAGVYYEEEDDKNFNQEFTPGFPEWAGFDTGRGDLAWVFGMNR